MSTAASGGVLSRLNRLLFRFVPQAPGPALLERVNDLRRSQVSLHHRIDKTTRSLQQNLTEVDALKDALEQRLTAVDAIRKEHERLAASTAEEEAQLNELVDKVQFTVVQGRSLRILLAAIVGLGLGVAIGMQLAGPAASTVPPPQVAAPPPAPDASVVAAPIPAADLVADVADSPPAPPEEEADTTVVREDMSSAAVIPAAEPAQEPAAVRTPVDSDAPMVPQPAQQMDAATVDELATVPSPELTTVTVPEAALPQAAEDSVKEMVPAVVYATVSAIALRVRSAPGTEGAVLVVLPEGARVAVLETQDGWSRVQADDGVQGWAAGRYLTILP